MTPRGGGRPSNEILETLKLRTAYSTSSSKDWSQEDIVRLIRAYECFPSASWSEIRKLFPQHHKHAPKNKYISVKCGNAYRPIFVSPELLFGCDPSAINDNTSTSASGVTVGSSQGTLDGWFANKRHLPESDSQGVDVQTLVNSGLSSGEQPLTRSKEIMFQPPGVSTPPKYFVVFRESEYHKNSLARDDHFNSRAQKLAQLYASYDNHPTSRAASQGKFNCETVPWTLIKGTSSNTNFTDSQATGVKDLRKWLNELQRDGFLRRVVLILSQVDGLSTNVSSLKSVFNFCRKLDLWLFFVHQAERQSLLHFQTLQGLVHRIEQGTQPHRVLEECPSAHDYIVTLMFMAGVGINKRNVSKNFQAQKQLRIGDRNNFDLDLESQRDTSGQYCCPRLDCSSKFNTSGTLGKHIRKDHVEGEEIDEFAKCLGLVSGLPVTPTEITKLLSPETKEDTTARPHQNATSSAPQGGRPSENSTSKGSINPLFPGSSIPSNPLFVTTRLKLPTTSINESNSSRVLSRPSDEQIANLVLSGPPSEAGEPYTLEDDIRLIRLKEVQGLPWVDIESHFPGRKWQTLQKRYSLKLTKAIADHRPDEISIRVLRGQSSGENYTAEEDMIIIKGKEIDLLNWPDIAKTLTGRTAQSAKYRYFHYLRTTSHSSPALAHIMSDEPSAPVNHQIDNDDTVDDNNTLDNNNAMGPSDSSTRPTASSKNPPIASHQNPDVTMLDLNNLSIKQQEKWLDENADVDELLLQEMKWLEDNNYAIIDGEWVCYV